MRCWTRSATTTRYPFGHISPILQQSNHGSSRMVRTPFIAASPSGCSVAHIRKVQPLQRALAGKKSWVTGLRREQSTSRQNLQIEAWDEANGLIKLSPLLEWTTEDVWAYLKTHGVPYNALHDRGYPSIGCAPCTRAVQPGRGQPRGALVVGTGQPEGVRPASS